MKKSETSSFQFRNFIIAESHIKLEPGRDIGENLNLGFNPRGELNRAENTFTLFLGVRVRDKEKLLKVDIEAVGYFSFSKEINEDLLDNYFYVNAPAILFPYIRAYVAALTSLSGLETITMPTINMSSLGNTLKEQTKEIVV